MSDNRLPDTDSTRRAMDWLKGEVTLHLPRYALVGAGVIAVLLLLVALD